MTISYNLNIPAANNDPSDDQPLMQINTNNISSYVAIDHIAFGLGNSGYHKVIHQLNNVTDPVAIPSPPTGQTYVKNVTENAITDTQLFFETGLGIITQLTGGNNAQFVTPSDGYQKIGGIIIQWGTVVLSASKVQTTTNLPLAFPNENLGVVTNMQKTSSQTAVDTVYALNFNLSTFDYFNTSNSTRTFNWIAIGW